MSEALEFTKCPLCERYVFGTIKRLPSGGRLGDGFKFRFDLCGFICNDCDKEIGPDEGRIKSFMLGGSTRQQALERLGYGSA